MQAARAFERDGLLSRTGPFIAVAATVTATLLFKDDVDRSEWRAGAVVIAVLVLAIFVIPWARLPRWTDAVVPLAFLFAVAILRNAEGGQPSTTGSLVLLPVLWFGLYGSSGEVVAGVAGAVAVLVLPAIVVGGSRYPLSDIESAINLSLIVAMVGFVVHTLVAGRAALAAEIAHRADTDSLTGLPNRGAWIRQLDRAVERAKYAGEPLCVAIIDIDGLKEINDAGGHLAGDRALTTSAEAWAASASSSAMLARLGGDEFGVIMPGVTKDEAIRELEALRRAAFPYASSAGLAEYDAPESARVLLGRADQALYGAKKGGRNKAGIATGHVIAELESKEEHRAPVGRPVTE